MAGCFDENLVMKTVRISDLKTNLSQYLRRVRRGEHLVVMDRNEPIAELIPLKPGSTSVFQRLAREGRLTLGTQDRSKLRFPRMKKLAVNEAIEAVQAESF